jgi:L-threonylcarbamoyladenylate synthase
MIEPRYDAGDLNQCLESLREGKRILLPTETGWALCTSAGNSDATNILRQIATENKSQPLTVLVHNEASIEHLAANIPDVAWDLLEVSDRPITLELNAGQNIPLAALSETGEIALRICRERFFRDLITRLRSPLICSAIKEFTSYLDIPEAWKADAAYASTYQREHPTPFQKEYRIKLGTGGVVRILK